MFPKNLFIFLTNNGNNINNFLEILMLYELFFIIENKSLVIIRERGERDKLLQRCNKLEFKPHYHNYDVTAGVNV